MLHASIRTVAELHSLVPLLKHVADHFHHLATLGLGQIIIVDRYKAGSFVLLLHFFESCHHTLVLELVETSLEAVGLDEGVIPGMDILAHHSWVTIIMYTGYCLMLMAL